jgi:hypothetical protein
VSKDYIQSVEVLVTRESGNTTRYVAAEYPHLELEEVRKAGCSDRVQDQARLSLNIKTTQGAHTLTVTES